jgi:hypothetical protein
MESIYNNINFMFTIIYFKMYSYQIFTAKLRQTNAVTRKITKSNLFIYYYYYLYTNIYACKNYFITTTHDDDDDDDEQKHTFIYLIYI